MATLKQIDANRRNALKSTGPKTPEGKAAVALNSLRHGLRARAVVLPGEDREEFQRLCDQLESEWQPRTRTEQAYAEQLAVSLWKLRRADFAEASVLVQRAPSSDQIPLLQYLWQAQSRLERAFSRAHLSLERMQAALGDARPPAADALPPDPPAPEPEIPAPKVAAASASDGAAIQHEHSPLVDSDLPQIGNLEKTE